MTTIAAHRPAGPAPKRAPSRSCDRFRRPPSEVMHLARLGSFHRSRLSFLDTMLREAARDGWRFARTLWEFDARGVGRAVYTVDTGPHCYSLVAFGHDLPDEERSDRVIATRWDATFALFDGVPEPADLDRLEANVPLQEAGRVSPRELTLARANRSVRLFEHVVAALAAGEQPDAEQVAATGYLMRTTAVYGSGKFGAADRATIAGRPELTGPFRAEMLTVWLIRLFTVDIVEWLAKVRGGADAARLDRDLARSVGVGNSTGLGMAPFLVRHPVLLNNWIAAREEALARVRARPAATQESHADVAAALARARDNAAEWRSGHPLQLEKLAALRADLETLATWLDDLPETYPYDALFRRAARLSLEGQEALASALIDAHGELVDDLAATMGADEDAAFAIDGAMPLARLGDILAEHYAEALAVDYGRPESVARFWYTSEEKLEPRLGERALEPGGELEEPLAVGRDAADLAADLARAPEGTVAGFLARHPEHRHAVRRAQTVARYPYAEIRDNLIDAGMLPIDLLRCKLSFFGADRFDPRSDRWVRVSLFQGKPHPQDILTA
ncbi:hypothetical protein [Acuticoccus sediminis]|uniref:hypothetical protein n=1 Tax=Acuticoccus sediminis TaxID=2184697 RepID=UPI001CFD9DD4|nr:hypothetical protein [Acuticoccus sediminis]